jgi:hypothetical protein
METAELTAVATLAPAEVSGPAFGLLAAIQSLGNLAASPLAGLLWTVASPTVAFAYLVGWMLLALVRASGSAGRAGWPVGRAICGMAQAAAGLLPAVGDVDAECRADEHDGAGRAVPSGRWDAAQEWAVLAAQAEQETGELPPVGW